MTKRQWRNILIVIGIVLIVIFFGWFWDSESSIKKQTEITDSNQPKSEREKLEKELQLIDEKIEYCHENEAELLNKKSKFFLYARIVIGIIIIGLNYWYYTFFNEYNLEQFLSINQLLLFSYSFIAFITYGTLENFSRNLKGKVVYFLHQNNFYFEIDLVNLLEKKETIQKKLLAIKLTSVEKNECQNPLFSNKI